MVAGCRLSVVRHGGTGAPAWFSIGSPTTDNRQRTTTRNVSEPSDVLLPLDRAAVVPGLGHHPIDRSEGQNAREGDRCCPTHRHEEPIERRLANVAEGEEEIPHLDGRLSGGEYRRAPEQLSVGLGATLLSVVRRGVKVRATRSPMSCAWCRQPDNRQECQRRQPDNRQPATDNRCW
jgi:hypothetical protein